MSNVSPSLLYKTWNKGALPLVYPGIFRFHAKVEEVICRFSVEPGYGKLLTGQPEDRAMQGCDPSAALEAEAGRDGRNAAPVAFNVVPSDQREDSWTCFRNRFCIDKCKDA